MANYRTIVVPYDFSEHSAAALATAVSLGRRFSSDLHLVHVIHTPAVLYPILHPALSTPELRRSVEGSLAGVSQGVSDAPGKVETHVVEGGNVAEMIRQVTQDLGADLIVMGTHGRTGLAHAFIGSVTERTLRRAPCPVLTVRAPE